MENITWFTRYQSTPATSSLRLFVFPFSGAGPSAFRSWGEKLPGIDVFCAVLPGRDKRLQEKPVTDMHQLVAGMMKDFLALADRPFLLFGHSMGALIAYEVACHAVQEDIVPEHLIVSAFRPPGQPRRNKLMHTLSDEDFIEALGRYGGTPLVVLKNRDLMKFALPALRADFQLHETYQHRHHDLLDCPITAFCGNRDLHVSAEEMHGWSEKTASEFSLRRIDGDHFFVTKDQERLMPLLDHIISNSRRNSGFTAA